MGVKYQDSPTGWVNGRYIGERMFSGSSVTQDAEMAPNSNGTWTGKNTEDPYQSIRDTERMGTITPDVMAFSGTVGAGEVMPAGTKLDPSKGTHDIPEVNTASVDDDE